MKPDSKMMTTPRKQRKIVGTPRKQKVQPGRVKIAEALKVLLRKKEFNAITTANIAQTSGMSEALIYRYFGDKRGLLHHVLRDFLQEYLHELDNELTNISGTLNKIRKIIYGHINLFETNRVLAKILLLEVRNYPGYFECESYEQVKRYSRMILKILQDGVENGELEKNTPIKTLRQAILGGIEHLCLPRIVFKQPFESDVMADELCRILLYGAVAKNRK